jgi:16S rRNA (guanine966-N2)-methyltransferase
MKSKTATGTLRIIAGKWRSRRLSFPAAAQLRPTANRIRETLFNWLQNDVEHEDCLDLFAGSGSCGLEALSRGARQVTFVEQNRRVADAIVANLSVLGASGMPVICSEAINWLVNHARTSGQTFGIVFMDPPYPEQLEHACCSALEESGVLKDRALIYLESDRDLQDNLFPAGWRILKKKRAGAVFYWLLERIAGNAETRSEQEH